MEPFKACRCGSTSFWKGPRGGASLNVTCTACGDRYNLLYHLGAPVMLIDILPPAELIDLSEEPHSAPTRSASQAPEET